LLKVQLNEVPQMDTQKALILQRQIHQNIQQNALCWQKIDFYLHNRIIPKTSVQDFSQYTPAGLLRKQQLLYASISKLQTRILENKKALSTAQHTADKNQLKKRIQKQQNGILYQKEILIAITKQIDAPSENT